jgi:hypothetical protein
VGKSLKKVDSRTTEGRASMLTADGCAQVSEIKRMKAITNRVVKRWKHRALAQAFEKWHHEVINFSCKNADKKEFCKG